MSHPLASLSAAVQAVSSDSTTRHHGQLPHGPTPLHAQLPLPPRPHHQGPYHATGPYPPVLGPYDGYSDGRTTSQTSSGRSSPSGMVPHSRGHPRGGGHHPHLVHFGGGGGVGGGGVGGGGGGGSNRMMDSPEAIEDSGSAHKKRRVSSNVNTTHSSPSLNDHAPGVPGDIESRESRDDKDPNATGTTTTTTTTTTAGGSGHGTGLEHSSKKRQVVSCGECKRRKIKCSRTHPCLACCRRGEPEACRWDAEAAPPKPDTQPFAVSDDLVRLAERVQALERWARTLPRDLAANAPEVQGFALTYYGNKTKKGDKGDRTESQRSGEAGRTREGSESSGRAMSVEGDEKKGPPYGRDQTEDAVVELESITFSQRDPESLYRPVDSLPFFDNVPGGMATHAATTPDRRRAPGTALSEPDSSTVELTSERTSLVALAPAFEGPFSGPALGLPLVSSETEFREARRRELRAIYDMLPAKALSYTLVDRYFAEVDWLHNVCYEHIFKAEHDRFWEMRENRREGEVDPMWTACYAMVLALGVDGLRVEPPETLPTPEETAGYRPEWWYACSLRLMELGDAKGRPQIRFIQTVILIGTWLGFSSTGGQASRCLSLLASALRAAQILGLHQMTSDPAQMPPPDPAWPPGANSIKREGALRLFGLLTFLDYMSATTRFRSYLLDPNNCSTPPVSNVNVSQLSATDWRIDPQPRNIFTESSFEWAKWRISKVSREVYARLSSAPSTFSYDTVLSLDAKFREAMREIDSALPVTGATTPARQWKRLVCIEGGHSRIVRLHRPFMLKKDYSRKCCLESGETVIRSHSAIQKATADIWFVYAHSLGAATALFADLFDAIDHDLPERTIEAKKEVLVVAFEIFSKYDEIKSPQLRQVVLTGSKILSGLFFAEEKRRVTRAANALVGANRPGDPDGKTSTESFAQVLHRLTLELDIPRPSPAPPTHQSLPPMSTTAHQSGPALQASSANYVTGSVPSTTYLPAGQGVDASFLPSLGGIAFDGTFNAASLPSAPLPGMVESFSSEFWKDGLGYGFGTGATGTDLVAGEADPRAGFDFWDLRVPTAYDGIGQSTPPADPTTTATPGPLGPAREGPLRQTSSGGYPIAPSYTAWGMPGVGPSTSASSDSELGGQATDGAQGNRRAAEVMMDQLLSSGW